MSLEISIPKPVVTLTSLPYSIQLSPQSSFIAPNEIQKAITSVDFVAMGASIDASQTAINSAFNGCAAIEAIDLTGWNTSNVTQMAWMFNGCTSLRKIWAPSTFTAAAVTVARYKPFYAAVGHHVDVYTDAASDADVSWGTINANFTIHWGSTHQQYEEA